MLLLDTTLTKIIWLNRSIVKAMFIQKIRFAFLKQKNFSSSNFWQSSFRCLWRSLSWLQCVEQINPKTFRSSHLRCSIKEAVLKNFAIFTGKHVLESLFDKVGGLKVFSSEYCEIFKNTILKNNCERLFLNVSFTYFHVSGIEFHKISGVAQEFTVGDPFEILSS